MAYEQGNIPDLPSEHRESRFSWKAVVIALIAIAVIAAPFVILLLLRGG